MAKKQERMTKRQAVERIITNLGGTMDNLERIWNDDNHELVEDMLLDVASSILHVVDEIGYNEVIENSWIKEIYARAIIELHNQGIEYKHLENGEISEIMYI